MKTKRQATTVETILTTNDNAKNTDILPRYIYKLFIYQRYQIHLFFCVWSRKHEGFLSHIMIMIASVSLYLIFVCLNRKWRPGVICHIPTLHSSTGHWCLTHRRVWVSLFRFSHCNTLYSHSGGRSTQILILKIQRKKILLFYK